MRNAVHPCFYPFMYRLLTFFPGSLPDSEWMMLSGAQIMAITRSTRTYLSDLAVRVSC